MILALSQDEHVWLSNFSPPYPRTLTFYIRERPKFIHLFSQPYDLQDRHYISLERIEGEDGSIHLTQVDQYMMENLLMN